MRVFQVVGYKNAGKTTVMEALIAYLTRQGYQVTSLKHHGHGGDPNLSEDTDSNRHRKSGAVVSGVQGESELQIVIDLEQESSWETIRTLYTIGSHDVMLLEGYKSLSYPKIVLMRHEGDLELLNQLDNIAGIGYFDQAMAVEADVMTFLLNDLESVIPKLAAYMLAQVKE